MIYFGLIYCYAVLNLYVSQLMYFVLDMANFLQCKDDLLQSFCHAFTIPPSFSQQIRAFWMLDHGHIKVYNQEAELISYIRRMTDSDFDEVIKMNCKLTVKCNSRVS